MHSHTGPEQLCCNLGTEVHVTILPMLVQGPPGSNAKAVGGFTIQPPSVLIFGNPSLYDIAALSKLGQCGANPSTESGSIFIEVRNLTLA